SAGVRVAAAEYAVPFPARMGVAFSRAPGGALVPGAVSRDCHPGAAAVAAAVGGATSVCSGKCHWAVAAQYPDGHGDQYECLAHWGCGQLASGLLYPGWFFGGADPRLDMRRP